MIISEIINQVENGYYISSKEINNSIYELEKLILKLKYYSNTDEI